jgi:DNA-binding response OmpR family regulator
MSTTPTALPKQVGILVLEQDEQSAAGVKQILDSEGWRVRIVPDSHLLLSELISLDWSLVIANVAVIGMEGPAFTTLRELGCVAAADGGRIRALFVIPETSGGQCAGQLEALRLPYVLRPFHLHDFLEKVSDLLVEVNAIEGPIRQVRHEFSAIRKKKKAGRATSMFASRENYTYTDEELAEYERQESESSKSKQKRNRFNLGDPHR